MPSSSARPLLLKVSFLCTEERFERMYKGGHLRRVYPLAERLQDMHDAAHIAAGGKESQVHAWFVFDRDYCGPATIIPMSIKQLAESDIEEIRRSMSTGLVRDGEIVNSGEKRQGQDCLSQNTPGMRT